MVPVKDAANGAKDGAKDVKENGNKVLDKDGKDSAYVFRPVSENPDDSPQRMRTRNKAAKEQTTNRGSGGARPKRGGNHYT